MKLEMLIKVSVISEMACLDDAACPRPMIGRLSQGYRDMIALVEINGLMQQDTAERMGLSLSGMKSPVQRGRYVVIDYHVRDRGWDSCKPSFSKVDR